MEGRESARNEEESTRQRKAKDKRPQDESQSDLTPASRLGK
jgi:hypothetical protein